MDAIGTATQTQAAPPPVLREGSVTPIKPEVQVGPRYVFMVGNLISAQTVAKGNSDWALGGVIRGDIPTLKWCSGYIRRCEIRELREYLDSDQATFVDPNHRSHKIGQYKAVERNQTTGQLEEVLKGDDGLLRTIFYPFQDVPKLTAANDGVVEMPCKDVDEMIRAQAFLFPNWQEIIEGRTPLPERVSQLRGYFMKRLAIAQDATVTPPQFSAFYSAVATAAIRSCDLFQSWCEGFTAEHNGRYDEAKLKGWAWNPGTDYDLACKQTGIARRDILVQEQSDKMDKMTDAVATLAEVMTQNARAAAPPAPENAPPPPAAQTAPEPVKPYAEPVAVDNQPPAPEIVTCLATTSKGTPCKNEAEADGFCKREDHNAAAEAAKASE